VNNPRNEELFAGLGIDASVSGTKLINAIIQEQVKPRHGDSTPYPQRRDVEIVEVELSHSSPILKNKIRDLALPAGSIFIAVIRGKEVIIPSGENRVPTGR